MAENNSQANLEQHFPSAQHNNSTLLLSPVETGERLSLPEELAALADEWIAATDDEQEKKALQATKEALLTALDAGKNGR